MKIITILSIIIIYFGWAIISFFLLSHMEEDIRKKYPSLINKRWKRILWLLSRLFFIPILIIPFFALDSIKEFLEGKNKEKY